MMAQKINNNAGDNSDTWGMIQKQEAAAWKKVAKEQKRTTSMEAVQDAAAAGKEGDKDQDADGGGGQEVAVRENIHCGEGPRPATHWKAVEGEKE